MKYNVQDKTIVITGVTRGLGRALAKAFVQAGAIVCGIGRSQDALATLETELSSENFIGIPADVSVFKEMETAIDYVVGKTGKVDVLFNNAALYPKVNFLDESADDWIAAIVTNLGGISNGCKAVLPHMVKAQEGKIYNLGSWADISPVLNSSAYSTSKGGVHALTKSIARDIESLGLNIEIHEWIPGHLNTRMSDFTGIDPDVSALWGVEMVQTNASSKNCIFQNDREWLPPKSIKHKVRDALLFWQ